MGEGVERCAPVTKAPTWRRGQELGLWGVNEQISGTSLPLAFTAQEPSRHAPPAPARVHVHVHVRADVHACACSPATVAATLI